MTNLITSAIQVAADATASNPWVAGGCFAGAAVLVLIEAWRRKRKARKENEI